jgi:hypothetical protein
MPVAVGLIKTSPGITFANQVHIGLANSNNEVQIHDWMRSKQQCRA